MKLRITIFLSLLALAIGASPPASAQSLAKTFTLNAANQNACIGTSGLPTIGIDLSGSGSMTLQPQVSINGSTPKNSSVTSTVAGSSPAATIVTSGSTSASYVAGVGGFDTFCLNVSSYSSGSLTVKLNPSSALNASLLGGSGVNFANVQSGTNLNTLDMGTGGILQPVNAGQVVANQALAPYMTLVAPSLTANTTGGNFVTGHFIGVQIALSTPSGTTAASPEAAVEVTSCSGGNSCSVTVTAPYLPPGYTYNVYSEDAGGSILANTSCQNISGNCILQSAGTGAAPPTVNTAYSIPSPLNANLCPSDVNPLWFAQDSLGNWNSWMGVDPASNNISTTGTPTFCRRTFFNDTTVSPAPGNNAFVVVAHTTGTGTSPLNQDRALWVSNSSPANDSATRYALEGIQVETDLNCNGCSYDLGVDSEITSISAEMADNTTSMAGENGLGTNVIRAEYFRNGTGLPQNDSMNVIQAIYLENNTTPHAIAFADILKAGCDNGVGGAPNTRCIGVDFYPGDGFAYGNVALSAEWDSVFTPSVSENDWFLLNRIPDYRSFLMGGIYLPSLFTNAGTIAVQGSLGLIGSLASTQINSATRTDVPSCATAGSASWVYRIVGLDAAGGQVAGADVTVSSCASTLNGTNTISLSGVSYTAASRYCFYRITSGGTPSTLGLLQCLTPTASAQVTIPQVTFVDNGIAGDGSTPPGASTNTTGAVQAYKLVTLTTCAAASSSGTVACGAAAAGLFSCDTGTSGSTCVIDTTAVTANSTVLITPNAADGTALSVTCNPTADIPTAPRLAAKSAGVSFTINLGTFSVNPECFEYSIVN